MINVKEIKQPDLNAKIVAYSIANQIEKRMPYKRAIKQALGRAMEKGAGGIKVKVGGRLNGAEIARKEPKNCFIAFCFEITTRCRQLQIRYLPQPKY